MTLPKTQKDRKDIPLFWGLVNYFRDALIGVAKLSMIGNEQHNPGEKLRWNREKGGDELDAQMRHLFQIGGIDEQLVPHSVRNAWRGLATCQIELEETPWDTPVAEIVELIRKQRESEAVTYHRIRGGICAPASPTPEQAERIELSGRERAQLPIIVLQHVETTQGPNQLPVVRIQAFGPFPSMNEACFFTKSLMGKSPVTYVTLANVSKLRTKKC